MQATEKNNDLIFKKKNIFRIYKPFSVSIFNEKKVILFKVKASKSFIFIFRHNLSSKIHVCLQVHACIVSPDKLYQ